ncbi:MAG: transcriptional regulator NrdR [Candidatus Omnitrophica bacterium CG11_big_fil_rev_8_21_14_0_20_64_10]|nr:MAG: transcriptional regulator NrdR [Candidatus Omnitrophica bacterium CG11_big_fil_rev_8_21_14_0_20_64_10]
MRCPFCGKNQDKVMDSREALEGSAIRRRRECEKCRQRYTTYERLEEVPLLVIKRDGRREPFDRKKILGGLIKACEKRPVPMERIEGLIEAVERDLMRAEEREIPSTKVGERVMIRLHDLDEVAYVRFASVYRSFKDINQFMKELRDILDARGKIK